MYKAQVLHTRNLRQNVNARKSIDVGIAMICGADNFKGIQNSLACWRRVSEEATRKVIVRF